jgi:hypothetical protein
MSLFATLTIAATTATLAGPAAESWRITHALPAPWSDAPPVGRDLAGQALTFDDGALRGPEPLQCEPARIEPVDLPAAGLFEGNLPAPAGDRARALGLSAFPVETRRVTCPDAGFDFHRADADTLLIGLDNRVWVLSRAAGATAAPDSPTGVVQRFLELHFSGDMAFTPASVAARADFLTPALQRKVVTYFSRPVPEDEVPAINGDPFTDSQEYPTRFAVGEATIEGATAHLPVRFGDGWRSYVLRYRLLQEGTVWRVDDVIPTTGDGLRAALQGR